MKVLFVTLLLYLPLSGWCLDAGLPLSADWAKRVSQGIERNRKSDCVIAVVDESGRAVPGATVTLRQKTHDFLFGCAFPSWNIKRQQPNPRDWAQFERYYLKLFNYATTENMLKWQNLEPEEGQTRYGMADSFLDWAEKHRIAVKGHTLVWGYAKWGYPEWLAQYPPEEITRKTRQHILDVVGRYKGRIAAWDVVNEPLHCHWFEEKIGPDYMTKALQWAHEVDPNALLLVNEYGNQWDSGAQKFAALCQSAIRQGAPINGLGEQAHDPPHVPSPEQIFEMFDHLASAGRDIHITEMMLPSDAKPVNSTFVKGTWTPEFQGQYYRYYYTLAFSYPNVKAITLWAMWDGASWLPQGGIIAKDWTPKPAYRELDRLINHEWMTNASGQTDRRGRFSVRGFHGRYSVTVTHGNTKVHDTLHISASGKNALTVRLR